MEPIQHVVNMEQVMIQDQIALEKLEKFLDKNKLPHQDIHDALTVKGKVFFGYYDKEGELVGSGGLELHGDYALLRSVAVRDSHRGKSLGNKIVNDLVAKASEVHVKDIFLLTETARDFFAKRGFKEVSRDSVPSDILATSEFAYLCPASARCMFYKLSE